MSDQCVFPQCRHRSMCESTGEKVCLNHHWMFTQDDINHHLGCINQENWMNRFMKATRRYFANELPTPEGGR